MTGKKNTVVIRINLDRGCLGVPANARPLCAKACELRLTYSPCVLRSLQTTSALVCELNHPPHFLRKTRQCGLDDIAMFLRSKLGRGRRSVVLQIMDCTCRSIPSELARHFPLLRLLEMPTGIGSIVLQNPAQPSQKLFQAFALKVAKVPMGLQRRFLHQVRRQTSPETNEERIDARLKASTLELRQATCQERP